MCRRAYISRQSPKPCLCQTMEYNAVHRLDFPQNAPAPPTLPRPATFSDIQGVACRTERKHIHRLSWLQPQRVILPPRPGTYRIELSASTSTESWPGSPTGRFGYFPCLVSFALKSQWNAVSRAIFPVTKVGLTVQRKTGILISATIL